MSDDKTMSATNTAKVISNPWSGLRRFTNARIALGRTGTSLPTSPHLKFQLAHALARNAVHHEMDVARLESGLQAKGFETLHVHSAAENRPVYLQRPDKGRQLDDASREVMRDKGKDKQGFDIALVVADGLSALAIEENLIPFLDSLVPAIKANGWTLGPVTLVSQGRVAIGDEIGALLGAKIVVMMIGERPGLSSPDSMGLYLTRDPKPGLTDEARNCISNVRPEGMSYDRAAHKLVYLITEARKRGYSGVELKDEAGDLPQAVTAASGNFLLPDK